MSAEEAVRQILAHQGPWTEVDYFALPEGLWRVELVDGSLILDGTLWATSTPSGCRFSRLVGQRFEEVHETAAVDWLTGRTDHLTAEI
jgi:hypothetical protein